MGSRFAGAQDQADRRRRWLANGDMGETQTVDAMFDSSTEAFPEIPVVVQSPELELVRYVISPTLWKHLVALSVMLMGGISLAYWLQSTESDLNFAHSPVSSVRLFDGCSGILMLLSGQLALLIGWLRSRSEVDFQGRYRGWKWMAVACSMLSVILLTGTTQLVPELLAAGIEVATGPVQAAKPAILFICCVTSAMLILGRVLPDMGRCLYSQALLVTAVLATVVRLMLIHGSAHASIDAHIFKHMSLFAAFATFASMLLHCRYVTFVCNDPPRRSISNPDSVLPDSEALLSDVEKDIASENEKVAKKVAPKKSTGRKRSVPGKSGKAA